MTQPPQPPPGVVRYGAGVPIPPPPAPKSKTPTWVWVLVGAVSVCCVLPMIVGGIKYVADGGKATPAADNQQTEVQTAPRAADSPSVAPPAPTSAAPAAPAVPAGPKTTFTAGMYEVGVEIAAGTYTCTATGSLSAYWERAKNASGEFDAIIANGNIKAGTQGIVTIKAKEFFKIDRGNCTIR